MRAKPLSEKARLALERAAAARPEGEAAPPAPGRSSAVPFVLRWPTGTGGLPNSLLRTAVFGIVSPGRRRHLNREVIASVDGVSVEFTGYRWDQNDLIGYQVAIHFAQGIPLGERRIYFTGAEALRLLDQTDTGYNRDKLHDRLRRIQEASLTIKEGWKSYTGSLIDRVVRDESTEGKFMVEFNPDLRTLFGANQWTALQWAVRKDLSDHQLAQWLYGYYSTHAEPYPVEVATLHRLCGSEAKDLEKWKWDRLHPSLKMVSEVCARHGEQFASSYRGDLVVIERSGSPSQRKHRAKKSLKKLADKRKSPI